MKEKTRTRIVVVSLFIMLPLVFIAGLLFGSESISLSDIKTDKFAKIILFDIRLPRTILALLCGSLLAGSGAVFQGFFRSPLALVISEEPKLFEQTNSAQSAPT